MQDQPNGESVDGGKSNKGDLEDQTKLNLLLGKDDERYDEEGRPCGCWSDLGFQDLDDDESFIIWFFRSSKQEKHHAKIQLHQHQLMALLKQDRLNALLHELILLFEMIPDDVFMNEQLLGFPMLTHTEERLLAILSNETSAEKLALGCEQVSLCRKALSEHRVQLRHPHSICRSGKDQLELLVAKCYGSCWGNLSNK